jgi:hypothetical protein
MTWASICRPEPSAVPIGPEYQNRSEVETRGRSEELRVSCNAFLDARHADEDHAKSGRKLVHRLECAI